jgi:hypothetical protein
MQDYEKLGAFYLGREATGADDAPLVLYDAADLTTHAVIVGMTGSGKTGLGIALIEEAAIDRVPVIAIDPKGDLGNLLLTFPALAPADFAPWVDARAAASAGQTAEEFAAAQAAAWRAGLAASGQGPGRIAALRAAADFALYTPGSSAGRGLSVLGSFAPPPPAIRADGDLYRQYLQGIAGGVLALAGIEADPLASREHILLATILDHAWQAGRALDLAGLVAAVPQPGIPRIGVLDLDSFFPPKDRMALAMRLNNLLAAPGFAAWTAGEPLDAGALFFTPAGQPRVSVLSIAHLGDAERMFFVTLLLNAVIAWLRTQPGTGSLRAILYMDEVFGYLPPTANPPSKALLLTLLKQARAYGLGLVLATQNPVDLDYKALSNAGTWFVGRLQTAQDRARLREGLLAAAGGLDPAALDAAFDRLGKRRFLLHNVHESAPVVFETRFVMSYLRGPLTRDDLRRLPGAMPPTTTAPTTTPVGTPPAAAPLRAARPVLPTGVPVTYADARRLPGNGERLVYLPRLLGIAGVHYASARLGIDVAREFALAAEAGGSVIDWTGAEAVGLDATTLQRDPEPDAGFADLPAGLAPAAVKAWQSAFRDWLRAEQALTIYRSARFRLASGPDESEGAFRARLQQVAREARDRDVAKLRQRHAAAFARLAERRRRAEQAVEREQEQATGSKFDVAVSVGGAVLGALFGRKAVSAATLGRVGSAVRKAGNAQKQSADVARAGETVTAIDAELARLEAQVDGEVAALGAGYDAQAEALEAVAVRPKASDITLRFFGVGFLPYIEDAAGNLAPAW